MSDFNNFDLSELYDLLTVYTKIYTKMLSMNIPPSEQFLFTKEIVDQLQVEIQSRTVDTSTESAGFKDGLLPAIA